MNDLPTHVALLHIICLAWLFQVHVDNLSPSDLLYILSSCNDQIPADVMQRMVDFNQKVQILVLIILLYFLFEIV